MGHWFSLLLCVFLERNHIGVKGFICSHIREVESTVHAQGKKSQGGFFLIPAT
jgi:hypothetical protein